MPQTNKCIYVLERYPTTLKKQKYNLGYVVENTIGLQEGPNLYIN